MSGRPILHIATFPLDVCDLEKRNVVFKTDSIEVSERQIALHCLMKLVPRAFKPANAVIFLARQGFDNLAKLAVTNGAQGYFVKSEISGNVLDQAIRKAIAVVGSNKYRQR